MGIGTILGLAGGSVALIVIIYVVIMVIRSRTPPSVIRPILQQVAAAIKLSGAKWMKRSGEGIPEFNADKETGSFMFVTSDASVSARFEATGLSATLRIKAGGTELRIDFIAGAASNVTLNGETFESTHWEVRGNMEAMRKLRTMIAKSVGFSVAPEDEHGQPKEFARMEKRRPLDYGRDDGESPKKKKRPSRDEEE